MRWRAGKEQSTEEVMEVGQSQKYRFLHLKPGEQDISPLSLNAAKVKQQAPSDPFERPRQTNHGNQSTVAN